MPVRATSPERSLGQPRSRRPLAAPRALDVLLAVPHLNRQREDPDLSGDAGGIQQLADGTLAPWTLALGSSSEQTGAGP